MGPHTSIVIPVLDEAPALSGLLPALQPLRSCGVELVIVDGGSRDGSAAIARAFADQVLVAPRGRAAQMNAGARAARASRMLVFLHADSVATPDFVAELGGLDATVARWGFFRPRLRGHSRLLPVIARCMWWRSRLTGIATGDQCLFVERALFESLGGYAAQPLMEDIELCARLRRHARPGPRPVPVLGSGRRWDRNGALRTILLMWFLRFAYFLGANPRLLHRLYYGR